MHHTPPQPAVYQVTRQGHEHCDVTDGMLLDIAPLDEGRAKIITLYDKDLAEGVNLLIGKLTAKSKYCAEIIPFSSRRIKYSMNKPTIDRSLCRGSGGTLIRSRFNKISLEAA